MSSAFRASRRRGVRGRVGNLRAVVEDDRDRTVLVRSPAMAETIAAALNGGVSPKAPVSQGEEGRRISRYAAVADHRGRLLVIAAERGCDSGLFGQGIVARTRDRSLAEEVVRILEEIDPAYLKEPPKGPGAGWW